MSNNQPAQKIGLQLVHSKATADTAATLPARKPQQQNDGRGAEWHALKEIKEEQQTQQQQQQGGAVSRQADDHMPRPDKRTAQFGTYAAGGTMKQQGDDTASPRQRNKDQENRARGIRQEERGYPLQMG